MKMPTRADLLPTFNEVATGHYNSVPGVIRLVVGHPKTKVVLAAMTHGDEPSGLGAMRFVLDNIGLLNDVELILAIHNIDGGARWFDAESRDDKHRCRALGWNFNRLPPDFPEASGGPQALERVRRLWRDVYPDTTHGLDMHSADQPLCLNGLTLDIAGSQHELDRVSDVIPATARFRGITDLQLREGSRTKPIGTVFGGPGKNATALEVESDSHESPIGISIAVRTVIALLTELGCMSMDEPWEVPGSQDVYDVLAATMVPCHGYRFVSEDLLRSFVPIAAGQELLKGPQGAILARNSGRLIFAPAKPELESGDEFEEVCFELSDCQPRTRTVRLPKWAMKIM